MTINKAVDFPGEAKATLLGLPNKVTAEPVTITKDTTEMVFHVKTEPPSPPGEIKSLFCQVVITQDGEPIVHNLGTGRLRIDKPLPAAKALIDRGEKQDHRHGLLTLHQVQAPRAALKNSGSRARQG